MQKEGEPVRAPKWNWKKLEGETCAGRKFSGTENGQITSGLNQMTTQFAGVNQRGNGNGGEGMRKGTKPGVSQSSALWVGRKGIDNERTN